ncbi:MAG: hypothetical protein WB780_10965 [Candidatus Acidiferrales bacterium]
MITLIFFLAAATGLLILLFVLNRRNQGAEGSAQALLEARHALRVLQSGLLPADFVDHIFARRDLEFVTADAPMEVRNLFVEERKKIALAWASEIRLQIVHLQHFHLGHSRHFARLKFTSEIALALDFAALRMECRALYLLFYLRGPFGAPYFAGKTVAAASRLCAVTGKSLAFLAPAGVTPMGDDSAQDGAAV